MEASIQLDSIPKQRFELPNRAIDVANDLRLRDYFAALDSSVNDSTLITAYTGVDRIRIIRGMNEIKPFSLFTDGYIAKISTGGRISFNTQPTYLAWISEQLRAGDTSPYSLETMLRAPRLRQALKAAEPRFVMLHCLVNS